MSSAAMTARVTSDMDAQTSTGTPAQAVVPDRASTDDGLVALSYILSGIVFYGGLGWAGWRYLDQIWMLAAGLIAGMAASMFLVIRRYSPTTASVAQTTEKEQ